MLLRLEDIDTGRTRPEFAQGILDDLTWMGIRWDGDVVAQSQRTGLYRSALGRLSEMGVLYPCFCTRREIAAEVARSKDAPHGPEGPLYPGTCRNLRPDQRSELEAQGREYALRLDVGLALERVGDLRWTDVEAGPQSLDDASLGDFVVARKDVATSYHLCVAVDDADQGVTLVTRGRDLFRATDAQRLIQALLGLPEPLYWHHGLVVDESGNRLAKRDRSRSIVELREAGLRPQDVLDLALKNCR